MLYSDLKQWNIWDLKYYFVKILPGKHNRKFIFQKERYTICMILNSGSQAVTGNFPQLFLKFLKLRNEISVWEFWRIGRQSFYCVNYSTVQLIVQQACKQLMCVIIPNLANVIALNVMHFILLSSPYCIMTLLTAPELTNGQHKPEGTGQQFLWWGGGQYSVWSFFLPVCGVMTEPWM